MSFKNKGTPIWIMMDEVMSDIPFPPVLNQWYTVLEIADLNGLKIDFITCFHSNDESAAKNIEIRLNVDNNVNALVTPYSQASGSYYNVYIEGVEDGWTKVDKAATPMMAGRGLVGTKTAPTQPLICKYFKLEARITSALGTNQCLWLTVLYNVLKAFNDSRF